MSIKGTKINKSINHWDIKGIPFLPSKRKDRDFMLMLFIFENYDSFQQKFASLCAQI